MAALSLVLVLEGFVDVLGLAFVGEGFVVVQGLALVLEDLAYVLEEEVVVGDLVYVLEGLVVVEGQVCAVEGLCQEGCGMGGTWFCVWSIGTTTTCGSNGGLCFGGFSVRGLFPLLVQLLWFL